MIKILLLHFFSTKHSKISLSKVRKCHVINFEQHLLHVVLSHCQYSLKTGFGTNVVYDFPALEKHLVDQFIHGKPEIDVNIPFISFKSDVVQTTGFAKVRMKIPQVNISHSAPLDGAYSTVHKNEAEIFR